ncbi:hypothetical protein GGR50DRAFT_650047 [Xylaria sp. CBS 124048]|nr:hypothetical protein GGR50DRAFT_650047 [Xylaria sp. CBS 124048]
MRSFLMSNEELGKKDDDHNKSVKGAGRRSSSFLQPALGLPRRASRRIIGVAILVVVVYMFIHNVPVLGPNDHMRRPTYPPSPVPLEQDMIMHPPSPDSQEQTQALAVNTVERDFNGPIKFYKLASSLQAVANMGRLNKQNVVFAAASLKSAATLLPIACEMGSALKNYVHFAIFGQSAITMKDLIEINGVGKSCVAIYHDARPDYAAISADERLTKTVVRGFTHLNTYLNPQVIITDASNEESFFKKGVAQYTKSSKTALIELPRMSANSLSWMNRLDNAALRMWNKIKIDILIQAIPGSSGSLMRLLRSLAAADYTASTVPHITIEFPHDIDAATKRFLETFEWPPASVDNPTNERYLTFRRRLSGRKPKEEEASTRFLESFWPTQPQSHVLVLSPNVKLAPQFFHYLRYMLLEYCHSAAATSHNWGRNLFGISLEQPLSTLDGKHSVSPPLFKQPEDINNEIGGTSSPYIWGAPSSNAVLLFGEKWMELHDFVSRTKQATESFDVLPSILSDKKVSKQHPSWVEHALRLARVRGYAFLYPGTAVAEHLCTVHGELYRLPEEYTAPLSDGEEQVDVMRQKVRAEPENELLPLPLLESLPNRGDLWPLSALPLAAWDGAEIKPLAFRAQTTEFELAFKGQVGGCDVESGQGGGFYEPGLTQDLFCNVPW